MSIAKKEGPYYLCRSLPFSKVLKSQCSLKWEVSMFLNDKALKVQPHLTHLSPVSATSGAARLDDPLSLLQYGHSKTSTVGRSQISLNQEEP